MSFDGRVLGEFTMRELIGSGGFASVYRAEQPTLDREAVIKVLHTRHADRSDITARFFREARLVSRLDHPFAAHVYAFGAETDGTLWIAMELVRGTPMDRWLATKGPIPVSQFVPLFERICEVVQTAHERGIVHRDLKPANVMILERAGRLLPKLLDFGIARVAGDEPEPTPPPPTPEAGIGVGATIEWVQPDKPNVTKAGAAMGSPPYMAPEQWTDVANAGPPADLYALGVLTYEALTGRVPFTGDLAADVMMHHLYDPPPALGDGLPAALDDVIARAMAKAPHERPASAGELAALVRAGSGLGEPEAVPLLPESLREAMTSSLPQPIAEAVAALEAARNVDQACAMVIDVMVVIARWIGVLALAARTRSGPGAGDSEATRELLRAIGRGNLDEDRWIELARLLTKPFAEKRDVHPLPELVMLLHGIASTAPVGAAATTPFLAAYRRSRELRDELERRAGHTHEERLRVLRDGLDAIARMLEPLHPLLAYTIISPRGGANERWRGPRRHPRTIATGKALPDGQVFLVDHHSSAPVLRLSPLVQIHRPAAGKDEELFVIDGLGVHGVRMTAVPYGYTHHDVHLGDWLRRQFNLAGDDAATPAEVTPYRGLAPFTVEDARFYFGREREIDAFVNRLRDEPLLAVVGPSGAGKSSFVQAGVLPRLEQRAIVVRPGASPIAALEARLAKEGIDASGLDDDPATLAAALGDAAGNAGIVLVVDQVEELFTLCRDDRARQRFAEALAACGSEDSVRIVLTLRDDFLARCDSLNELRELGPRGLVLLGTPASEDLERIVIEPALRAGYDFEDRALATEMVDDVAAQPGALALLSFAASELWKLRDRHFRQLSRKAYQSIGGVSGALARHAEETLAALRSDDAPLVREAFRHLVTAEGTRQVLASAELRQVLVRVAKTRGVTDADARTTAVIDRLVSARLLVVGDDERVEVIHEALFAAWPRLVTWRREDAEGAHLRDQLRVAAQQWATRGRSRGLLWRDDALAEYRIWRTRYQGELTDLEHEFAASSVTAAARSRRRLRIAIGSAFGVLVAVLVTVLYLRAQATTARTLAETRLRDSHVLRGRQALIAGDSASAREAFAAARAQGASGPALALMEAYAQAPLDALVATLTGYTTKLSTVAFSPDGTRVLTASIDGSVRVWDVARGAQLFELPERAPFAAWRPDGSALATLDASGRFVLWDANGKQIAAGAGPRGEPRSVVFRADALAATATRDGHIAIWDSKGALVRTWLAHAEGINTIAFDPVRDRILSSGPTTPIVWTLTGERAFELRGHADLTWVGAYDPTGRFIVTASLDQSARIWSAETGALLRVLAAHERRVTWVAFDATGEFAATASADTTIRVWHVGSAKDAKPIATLRGHTAQVNWIEFVGDHIVSIAADGTARVWDPKRGVETATFAHGGFVNLASVDRRAQRIVTSSWDGSVKLWDLRRQMRLASFEDPIAVYADTGAFAFLHGQRLVRGGGGGVVAWDLTTRKRLWRRERAEVTAVDATATLVATGNARGAIALINPADGAVLREMSATTAINALALHPDGSRIVTASDDGTVGLWDAKTGQLLASHPLGKIYALRYSPTGDSIVAYTPQFGFKQDCLLLAADLSTRAALPHASEVFAVEYSPDGQRIATASWDGRVAIWSSNGKQLATITRGAAGILQWTIDGKQIVLGSDDGSLATWDVARDRVRERSDAHGAFIAALGISRDGTFVVTAGADQRVKIWELATLTEIYELRTNDIVDRVDVGTTLVTSTRTASDVWQLGR